MSTLMEVKNLKKYFPVERGFLSFKREKKFLKAVDSVSFNINKGESLALVGESGCGKTTVGKIMLKLLEPTAGEVRFRSRNIFEFKRKENKSFRTKAQIIFQDVTASLNPRKTLSQILAQPFKLIEITREERNSRIQELLETVELTPPSLFIDRYPHELSGGQRQRIGIARAIALRPEFIVADEPVSALDMSIRAIILNLMRHLQVELKLTYFFITHDLAVVRSVCNKVAVMYLGRIVELGLVEEIFNSPLHPYTRALLSATPIPDPKKSRTRSRLVLSGDVPSPIDLPPGCPFHTRCYLKESRCSEIDPEFVKVSQDHFVRCHLQG